MATIRDVAKLAGVSLGTVSNVLNNSPSVSEKKRACVEQAIAALHYVSNQAARGLRSGSMMSIALVIPDITNPFYPEIARGAEETARQNGYTLMLCNKERSPEIEKSVLRTLIGQNVSGIMLFKTQLTRSELEELQMNTAVVLMDADADEYPECDHLQADDAHGIRVAMQHIYDMGHRRIGFISGTKDSHSNTVRVSTYRESMERLALPIEDGYFQIGDYTMEGGKRCIKEMMLSQPRPTAVLCANDLTAIGAMQQAYELGFRLPSDLSIVGYDDVNVLRYSRPALTTVWHPKYEMGQKGVEMLVRRIRSRKAGAHLERQFEIMSPHFVWRESLSSPRIIQ